ncbi:MAG: hypothetical protein H7Z41_19190 [Cytophagales bacterium]|nr:hypothetical protein [Armatimonadota bacterium]
MNFGTASAASNATEAATSGIPAPFRPLIIAFAVTALLALFVGTRLNRQGQWLPPVPDTIVGGGWSATDVPLDAATLKELGNPKVYGRRYTNPFNEHVDAHIIAATSIESYHEPAFCMAGYGYTTTAQKNLPLFGPGNRVRALVLRGTTTGQRILLYFWVQDQEGKTSTQSSFRSYQDYVPRLNLGVRAAVDGDQSCIVRAYTVIHPADPSGRQARRNLDLVARELYHALKKGSSHRGAPGEDPL